MRFMYSRSQLIRFLICLFFFFFNDTATTEIYTLSLHDALPIWSPVWSPARYAGVPSIGETTVRMSSFSRSEEHTSELQSLAYLVCRLLLEKKKQNKRHNNFQERTVLNHLILEDNTW